MSLRRQISWSSARVDFRNDRTRLPAGVLSAKGLTTSYARIRKVSLVTPNGAFDRSTIMALAVVAARQHQLRTGSSWKVAISAALKGAWLAAKDARHAAAH